MRLTVFVLCLSARLLNLLVMTEIWWTEAKVIRVRYLALRCSWSCERQWLGCKPSWSVSEVRKRLWADSQKTSERSHLMMGGFYRRTLTEFHSDVLSQSGSIKNKCCYSQTSETFTSYCLLLRSKLAYRRGQVATTLCKTEKENKNRYQRQQENTGQLLFMLDWYTDSLHWF